MVGRGGQAVVHLAQDLRLERLVAIKLLHPSLAADEAFLRRFRKEATLAARLAHRNVVAVLDWGPDGAREGASGSDQPYIVTELLRAGSLADLLATGFRASPAQALLIGLQAARGLVAAQAAGLVHRDIKPANLLFDVDGRMCVADFGIARALDATATVGADTVGSLLGTARYASPEQVEGTPVDGRSDVYSLALCVIEAMTGETPFSPKDGSAVSGLVARVGRDLSPPPGVGQLYDALLAAGRADPAQRSDARAFGRALKAAAADMDRPERLPLAVRDGLEMPALPDTPAEEVSAPPERPVAAEAIPDATVPMPRVVDAAVDAPAAAPEAGGAPPEAAPVPSLAGAYGDTSVPRPPVAGGGMTGGGMTGGAADEAPVGPLGPRDGSARPPRRGRLRRALVAVAVVAVLASGGAALAIFKPWKPYHDVPPLRGETHSEAVATLAAIDLTARVVGRQHDEDVPVGAVLSAVEHRSQAGTSVRLVESLGPAPRTMPTTVGLKEADVKAALVALRLQTTSTLRADEIAVAGTVLESTPAVGAELARDQTVALVVSSGPAPRTIPALAGMSPDQAKVALGALGLVPAVSEAFDDVVAKDQVVRTDPPAGKSVARGATVTLVVSKGQDLVVVPNVVGSTAVDAQKAIEAAGLKVSGTTGPPAGVVTATAPGAGASVKRGSGVQLTTK